MWILEVKISVVVSVEGKASEFEAGLIGFVFDVLAKHWYPAESNTPISFPYPSLEISILKFVAEEIKHTKFLTDA